MANANIAAGLAKGTGYTSKDRVRKPPRLAHLIGQKHTLENFHLNQHKAVHAFKSLRLLGDRSAKKMQDLEAMIRDRWSGPGAGKNEGYSNEEINGVPVRRDFWGSGKRKEVIDTDLERAQVAVNEEQADELAKIMKSLGEAGAANGVFRKGLKTPHIKLLFDTIGETRNNLSDHMEKEGVMGVERGMAKALSTNDAVMAAAACIAYDTLSEAQKQLVTYSRDDIAEAFVWTEWCAMNVAAEKTLYAVDMGHLLANTMQGREVAPEKKIGISLRINEAMNNLGLEFDQDDLAPPAGTVPAAVLQSERPAEKLTAAEAASAKLAAEHKVHSEKHAAFMAAEWGSPESVRLSRELGYTDDEPGENEGNENE